MDVAELGDVREHLVGAGTGDRAGDREGIAGQDEARPPIVGADREIGGPHPDVAGNAEFAGDPGEPGQRGIERSGRVHPHRTQPGIVGLAIDEQVGAHPPLSDRKQRQIGNAVARPLREIGQRREGECRPPDGDEIEAERD
jgi:hypothetical protein